jgi:hypothetical protein
VLEATSLRASSFKWIIQLIIKLPWFRWTAPCKLPDPAETIDASHVRACGFSVGFIVLVAITLGGRMRSGLTALWLPVMLILSRCALCHAIIQIWMFASPAAYPSSLVQERWRWLYGLNPLAGVIDGFRWSLTGHGQPTGPLLLAFASAVQVILLGGLFFFQRMQALLPTAYESCYAFSSCFPG